MDALRSRAPRAMHVAEICGRLGVEKTRLAEVEAALAVLTEAGTVSEMPGRRFRVKRSSRRSEGPPAHASARPVPGTPSIIRGVLQRNPRGFAFLAPDDGTDDAFIPPDSMGAALHGDRVEVAARPSPKGREGRVITVLERRPARFSATLQRGRRDEIWLEPDDPRLPERVDLIGVAPKDKASGLAVVARFVRFPQGQDDVPGADIVEVLGLQGLTAVEVAKLKIREGIVEEFREEVLEEARAFPNKVPEADKKNREDLRDVDLCTIDPDDARDHDDALFCERVGKNYRVIIAIADVSHYVREGTEIDAAAFERATSIYLPDRAIPMLPPELSSHLASLIPDVDRLCMCVEAELGPSGALRSSRIFEGVMRSGARLTYRGVTDALDLGEGGIVQPEAKKRVKNLQALHSLAKSLRSRRLRRGALDFDLPEPRVVLDEDGVEPLDVKQSRKEEGIREAYRIVEEMMLLANEIVAAKMTELEVPSIYRIHGTPDDKKIENFAKLAVALGYNVSAESAKDPKQLSKFLGEIDGTEHAPVLRYLLLRAMQQASYDPASDVGHFGLAAKDYLHFTSPIRRYPDLVVHRILKKVLRGEPIDAATLGPKLRRISADVSRLERRAMSVERDVIDLYRAVLLKDRIGEEFDGIISGVDRYGFYVRFDEPFAEAKVPLELLGDDYYELGELGIRLIGARTGTMYSLGDPLRIRLEEVNIARRDVIGFPVGVTRRAEDGESRRRGQRKESGGRGNERGRGDSRAKKDKKSGDDKDSRGRDSRRKGSQDDSSASGDKEKKSGRRTRPSKDAEASRKKRRKKR